MDFIIEFYKGLDTINLIIFWGVIIVVLLLLIFSIILANKNRELKRLLLEKEEEPEEDGVPVSYEENVDEVEEKEEEFIPFAAPISTEESETVPEEEVEETPEEEEPFVAEEHVMPEYPVEEEKEEIEVTEPEITTPLPPQEEPIRKPVVEEKRMPYQKNVLRDMPRITSPIGYINNENKKEEELNKESEEPKHTYLDEVSEKLAQSEAYNNVERTNYELKQEEDAIISYEELMRKKDSLNIVDEEDAVISIDELLNKRKEKLYHLTDKEENDEFIKELKHFRNDL